MKLSLFIRNREAEDDGVSPWRGWRWRLLLAVPREGGLLVVAHVGGLVVVVVASRAVGLTRMTITTATTLVRRWRTVSTWEIEHVVKVNYTTTCDWQTNCEVLRSYWVFFYLTGADHSCHILPGCRSRGCCRSPGCSLRSPAGCNSVQKTDRSPG